MMSTTATQPTTIFELSFGEKKINRRVIDEALRGVKIFYA
jgi:hypothetical protein